MKYWIGIDEVGRGSLAGPVAVAAVLWPKGKLRLGILRDSKQLTARQRLKWFKFFRNEFGLHYSVCFVGVSMIDKINIRRATNLASRRAFLKLKKSLNIYDLENYEVITDGGLFLGKDISHRTIIHGDERFNAIKVASIMAKVTRDRLMVRRHKTYPEYGLKNHKGYGTRNHCENIKKYGPTIIHRLTFLKNLITR